MKKLLICLIFFLTIHSRLTAQVYPAPSQQQDLQLLIEQLFPVQDDELPYEDLYEALLLYYNQPLDLNQATAEELKSLLILTEPQIQSFFRHIERNGKLLSIYELQSIPNWDLPTIYRILPFVQVSNTDFRRDNRSLLNRIRESGQGMLLLRHERVLEERAGYLAAADSIPPAYTGSPDKFYSRFRYNRPHDFSFGFTLEKDAGEPLSWNPEQNQYGVDFFSFHALLYNQGRFRKIVIGDYQLQFGQSLIFGSGFTLGKGSETITTLRRSSTGIRPYTSALESGFFRGAAITYSLTPQLEITTFYSNTARDALLTTSEDTLSHAPSTTFSSLQESGFHRTLREIEAKGSVREQSTGAVLHYKSSNRRFQAGVTSLFTRFSLPWQPNQRLYNQFEFNGHQNITGSVFSEYTFRNINLFAEAARSQSGGSGIVAGSLLALSRQLDFSILFRRYERDFHSFYGTAFAEGSRPINEQGIYWGIRYAPTSSLSFTAYFDRFSFPWLRYRVDAPSGGYEYLLRFNYQPQKNLLVYVQFRQEEKDINSSSSGTTRIPEPGLKQNYLLNLDFAPDPAFSFRSRIQGSQYLYAGNLTRGFTLVQDVNWNYRRFRFSGRMALFDTDDYQNRQYVYEKDVLWAFSIPAYYGRGIRTYLLAQCKLTHNLSLWLRWARTYYTDRNQISSGQELIEGNSLNQIKSQIRWTF